MKKIIFSVMSMLCIVANTFAQDIPKISNIEKVEVLKKVCTLVKNEYVFAEVGNIAGKKIEENLKAGKYLLAKDVMQFSEMLTTDLQTITKDEHFRVVFSPEQVEMLKNEKETKNDAEVDPRKLAEGKYYNFAFDELKILEGNIGYLNLTGFFPLSMAKETITSAMNFLSNTDAVIIDLRNNRGGSLDMPPYLASYFLSDEKQTLLQFINRDNKEEDKTETTQQLEGKRLFGKPLYILTSNKTFSAAEAFTYPLKNRNVAITVGEKTGGGANPIVPKVINENFVLGLPTYRPIDPITATNWEGTGIQPDIEVTADKAKRNSAY
jgi:retinol-binding protein 3